ncbi:DUF2993 domain-containing protein [Cryobacterium cryoconiti]|uniref:DUF2993 domain-containing protein n=1 Tax=Cryobacterium cryoconiti TaxID=1259239 RepID=A0A4Y8JUZ4_9MICO|nr:DUF2993 domain-containing protein [Cryobacterium cryoconiti]TFD31220.1 DUF2993 domain-containing protein [Cryobacterium cryoconiti]
MDASGRKSRRRGLGAFVVAGLVVLGLVAAFFFIDGGLRGYAEGQVEQEIAANLPETVTGHVSVSIGGLSVIAQYLGGSFDRVALESEALTVDGVPASVHVVATDVPLESSEPVGDLRGIIDLEPAALSTLLARALPGDAPDASVELGADEVSYSGSAEVLGFPIGYRASAVPTADTDALLLTPSGASVTSGGGSVDAGNLLSLVLGDEPVRICVAEYLPEGVTLAGVNVTPERARLTLQSSALTLTRESLTTLGSCANG